jgi:hypothetical protein
MDDSALEKSPAIIALLNALRERSGGDAFCIVDHWYADLDAIGIGSPHDRRVLAYVSCSGQPEGRYYVELELPPVAGDNFPYEAAGSHEDLDLESLIAIVASHLARGEPRNV